MDYNLTEKQLILGFGCCYKRIMTSQLSYFCAWTYFLGTFLGNISQVYIMDCNLTVIMDYNLTEKQLILGFGSCYKRIDFPVELFLCLDLFLENFLGKHSTEVYIILENNFGVHSTF